MEKKVADVLADSLLDKLGEMLDDENCVKMLKDQEVEGNVVLEKVDESFKKIENYLEVIRPFCEPFDVSYQCREIDLIFQDVQSGIKYLESRFEILKEF
jgi:hypothetical protein